MTATRRGRDRRRGNVQVEFIVFTPAVVLAALVSLWLFHLRVAQVSVAIDARNTAWATRLRHAPPIARLLPLEETGVIRRRATLVREPAWWSYESTSRLPEPGPLLRSFGLDAVPLRVQYALRDGGPIPGAQVSGGESVHNGDEETEAAEGAVPGAVSPALR